MESAADELLQSVYGVSSQHLRIICMLDINNYNDPLAETYQTPVNMKRSGETNVEKISYRPLSRWKLFDILPCQRRCDGGTVYTVILT